MGTAFPEEEEEEDDDDDDKAVTLVGSFHIAPPLHVGIESTLL